MKSRCKIINKYFPIPETEKNHVYTCLRHKVVSKECNGYRLGSEVSLIVNADNAEGTHIERHRFITQYVHTIHNPSISIKY